MDRAQRTALVVEYDSWQRSFVSDVLSAQGYAVLATSNGATGLRLAERDACNLILLDLALPELPGREVLRELKERRRTSDVPVILFGPAANDAWRAEGMLESPLNGVQIVEEVGRVLARQSTAWQPVPFDRGRASADAPGRRRRPLVLMASPDDRVIERVTERARQTGSVAYAARSAAGCLRVATAIGPDVVLLDPILPKSLESRLRAHPVSANARILHLSERWASSPSVHAAPGQPPRFAWPQALRRLGWIARLGRRALA